VSYPTRSQIFKDKVWTIKGVVANPSLDTFYQVDFSFSNYRHWLDGGVTDQDGRWNSQALSLDLSLQNEIKKNQNLNTGSKRLKGINFQKKLSLLCNEAEIPGTSYLTTQVDGNHQGISETFPTYRQFPPLNLSFYLDADHVVLEVFEQWMKYINPVQNDDKASKAYTRFAYPETYKEKIHLTKYERDFATTGGSSKTKMSQYEFINIWPTNMTSMRVNYGSSDVIKVSVQLAYDRFRTQFSVVDSHVIPIEQPFNSSSAAQWNRRSTQRWGAGSNFPFLRRQIGQ